MQEGVPHGYDDKFPNLDKHFRFNSFPFGKDYFFTTGKAVMLFLWLLSGNAQCRTISCA